MLQAATTGDVLVIDMGGAAVSTLGVLIDGGCRNLEEIRPTALWMASSEEGTQGVVSYG